MPKDDLSRKNLDAISLADTHLVDADISHSSLRHAQLRRAKLAGADLSGSDLAGADLQGADLTDATLQGTNLTQADLRAANVEQAGTVKDIVLTDAKGVSVALTDRVLAQASRPARAPRHDDPGQPASEQAQAEQDRQLATGEENPA
jgi:uncharacterized protein YjbI with pentapeptide repeats